MPNRQSPSCPSVFLASVSPSARSEASEKKTREASRSESWACSTEMPRCRSDICACV